MRGYNPAELEIDLFCRGIRIDPSCDLANDARSFTRTRAGLGSGLELVVPAGDKDIWVNVPVEEHFAKESPFRLMKQGAAYVLADDRDPHFHFDITVPGAPGWYSKKTSRGTPMTRIGVLQGTYLGIYLGETCRYWLQEPKTNCRFCTTGLNVGVNELKTKEIDDVVETAMTAKAESGVTFVHFNSGLQAGDGLDLVAPYVKALKEKVGVLVGVQVIPSKELWKYDWLIDLGVDHFSFCYEFHNPAFFEKYLPGKCATVGQRAFFDAMEYTAKKMGKGRNSGEIVAGVEPVEDTLKAIDYITSVGCFPTVCIFRPLVGSDMERSPPPEYSDMVVVMRHMYDSCRRNGIPVGMAPNIEVSLIVNPDDAKYLADSSIGKLFYEAKRKVTKALAFPLFARKMRRRKVQVDAFDCSNYRP